MPKNYQGMSKKYKDESWLREQYVEKGRPHTDIADECGVTRKTIGYYCQKFNMENVNKNDPTYPPNHRINPSSGYEEIRTYVNGEGKRVHVHRLVAVAEYGIEAFDGHTHVHHKNGHRFDNRPQNLEPLTPEEHRRRHADD